MHTRNATSLNESDDHFAGTEEVPSNELERHHEPPSRPLREEHSDDEDKPEFPAQKVLCFPTFVQEFLTWSLVLGSVQLLLRQCVGGLGVAIRPHSLVV